MKQTGSSKVESSPEQSSPDKAKQTPKVPTAEDMERYKGYVGQQWTGICKWFNVSKGFGFAVPDYEEAQHLQDDVFVHQSALKMPGFRSIDEGEHIQFTVRLGKRGLEAEDVTGVEGVPLKGHSIRPLGKRKDKEQLIRCYNCGRLGTHVASKCKNVPAGSSTAKEKTCYECHATDHLLADCPQYAEKKLKGMSLGGRQKGSRKEDKESP